jgi:hypothetical protein
VCRMAVPVRALLVQDGGFGVVVFADGVDDAAGARELGILGCAGRASWGALPEVVASLTHADHAAVLQRRS